MTNQQELDCVEHNLEIESCQVKDLTTNKHRRGDKLKKKNVHHQEDINVLMSLFENESMESTNLNINVEDEDNSRLEDSKNWYIILILFYSSQYF